MNEDMVMGPTALIGPSAASGARIKVESKWQPLAVLPY
jgi:hypothetical protein